MEKINFYDIELQFKEMLKENKFTRVITLKNGNIFKNFSDDWLIKSKREFSDIETRLTQDILLNSGDDLCKPVGMVYFEDWEIKSFLGYVMNKAKGISLDDYMFDSMLDDTSRLEIYNKIHSNLNNIIKKYDEIVFPDLCAENNIFIEPDSLNLQLIDCDGFQIGKYTSGIISEMVAEDKPAWKNSKYLVKGNTSLYTKELDKRSLILLYFYYVFNVDLFITQSYVNRYGEIISPVISLDKLFNLINLKDDDIKHIVWLIFQMDRKKPNHYLEEDLLAKLADEYTLEAFRSRYGNMINGSNGFCRRLVPKKGK